MIFGGWGFGIALLRDFIVLYVTPFLISFILSYFILRRILLKKEKKRFHNNGRHIRPIWILIFSVTLGIIGMFFIQHIILVQLGVVSLF